MIRRIAVVCIALFPPSLAAQEPAPPGQATLSLDEALTLARQNNPGFQRTENDIGAADWNVRNAYANFLPSFSITGGLSFQGPGEQRFLTTSFRQESGTLGSSYSATLNWLFSGTTLTEPGRQRAERDAVLADVDNAERNLESNVTQFYIAILQGQANVDLQRVQVDRNGENLRLAEARFNVGQATLLDVRTAQVQKGQADVELLRLEQLTAVAKLRMFQELGINPPTDISAIQLTDSFPVIEPSWDLAELQNVADQRNPTLNALRKRGDAASWQVKSAGSSYLPSLSVQAGWSGFTQQLTNVNPTIGQTLNSRASFADAAMTQCSIQNAVLSSGLNCNDFAFSTADAAALESTIRANNSVFPFNFTQQPFQARLSITLPIFDNFSRELQLSRARAARQDAEFTTREQELTLLTNIAQAHYNADREFQTIAIQNDNRSAAGEQVNLARERYRVGAGSFFELVEAQLSQQQAERDYVNAVYAYHRSVAALEALVGMRLR